jgi:hypothetical protein
MTNVPLSRKGRSKGCPGREPAPKTQCLKDNGNPNQLIKDVIALGGVFYYGFFFFQSQLARANFSPPSSTWKLYLLTLLFRYQNIC